MFPLKMSFWNRRRDHYQSFISRKRLWNQGDIIGKMNVKTGADQIVGERRGCFVVTRDVFANILKIPRQGTHSDASDSYKIHAIYLAQIHFQFYFRRALTIFSTSSA